METIQMEKVKKLVPEVRFDEFDGQWKKNKIGEVLKIGSGKDYKHLNEGFVPVFGTGGLMAYVNKPLFTGETVFIGRKGSIDKPFYYNGDFWTVDTLFYTFNFTLSTPKFIYAIFQKINWYQHNEASGVPSLSKRTIESITINIPSLPEQQKIASFLSSVDEKIQQLTRKKELLDQYKKGVMQQLFSGKLRFKDENGTDFPNWEEKRLGDLTYKVGRKNKENIQYPIYSINNQEGFRPQSEQFDGLDSNERGYDISMYKIVHSETFAYNPARINVGSIGYSYDLNEVIISSLYVCFKTKGKLEDLFLLAYLDSYNFKKDILRYEEGGVRQYLFYENFSHIKIPLPSVGEQKQIAKFLSSIETKIERTTQQITQTQTFKKGLLQKMFV
jgi:type I restriction enzyme S subunit